MVTFGGHLRARRHALGLSQQAVAQDLGCSKQYLSDIERGQRATSQPHFIAACARVLGTHQDYLYFLCGHLPPDVRAVSVDAPPERVLAAMDALRHGLTRGEAVAGEGRAP